jgi:hypothetical protein
MNFDRMTVDQLVERFVAIAVEQDRALLYSEIAKYNKLFDQMTAVKNELKGRAGDRRRSLMSLYEHPNWQVRLMAAHATLVLEPVAGDNCSKPLPLRSAILKQEMRVCRCGT